MAQYDGEDCYDGILRYDDDEVLAPRPVKRMKKIKLPLSTMDQEGLETYCEGIVSRTDTKPAYAAVQDKVTALKTRVASYRLKRLAMEAAVLEAAAKEDVFDDERALLVQAVAAVANGVEGEANGSVAYITDAGFSTVSPKLPIGPLDSPQNLTVKPNGMEGALKLRWKRVRGAKSYIIQTAANASGPWTQCGISPRASHTVENLTSGTKYWFRVQAIGTSGPSGWSGDEGCMAP